MFHVSHVKQIYFTANLIAMSYKYEFKHLFYNTKLDLLTKIMVAYSNNQNNTVFIPTLYLLLKI